MEMYVHINPSIGKRLCGKRLAWGRGVGNSFFFSQEICISKERLYFCDAT